MCVALVRIRLIQSDSDQCHTHKFYKEVNCIKKGFNPQTLLIINKEGCVVSNKEKVLQMWSEYYEKHFELQDGMDNDSGEEWTRSIQTPEQYVEPKNERTQEGHL